MITINVRLLKYPLILMILIGGLFGLRWAYHEVSYRIVESKVKGRLEGGYLVLASEIVLEHRDLFESSAQGCRVAIEIFGQAGNSPELRRAVEKCLYEKVNIEEIPLALAMLAKGSKRPEEALVILQKGFENHPQSGVLLIQLAQTMVELKQHKEAADLLRTKGAAFLSTPQFMVQAFQLFLECAALDDARNLAPKVAALGKDRLPRQVVASLERLEAMGNQGMGASHSPASEVGNSPNAHLALPEDLAAKGEKLRFLPGDKPGTSYYVSKDGKYRYQVNLPPEEAEKKFNHVPKVISSKSPPPGY